LSLDLTIPQFDPRDQKTYYFHETAVRRMITTAVRSAFPAIGIRTYEGVENLPLSGPVVLAANHLTNYDVFPIQLALPRPVFFMGKEELFRNPGLDWVLRQLGGFPVLRGAQDEWAIRHAHRVLERGLVLGIFPEGKRSKGRGLQTAKTGAARLALSVNCPVVPLAIHGPQYMFRHFPRRTPVHIQLGKPVFPQAQDTSTTLTERIMFALAELLPPEARGVYAHRQ